MKGVDLFQEQTDDIFLSFADPLLAALADNGGPTATRALGAASPAVDAADVLLCPAADQRGVLRDRGAGCDRGAYERVMALRVSPSLIGTDADVTLTVRGAGFDAGSVVSWEGMPLPTTLIDSLILRAELETAVIGSPAGYPSLFLIPDWRLLSCRSCQRYKMLICPW